jgi:uncharacterized protein YebE (UPF0316 family)
MDFFSNDIFSFVILPILIFLSRVCDVSIGTIRIIFVSRGKKNLAPLLGFFEVFIWMVAMGQIMKNLDNILYYISYAGGFAVGNYIGILIEEKLAIGLLSIRVFVPHNCLDTLKEKLIEENFGFTLIKGFGAKGEVDILFIIFKRKDINKILDIVNSQDIKLFYSIEEMKTANKGIFPLKDTHRNRILRSIKNKK